MVGIQRKKCKKTQKGKNRKRGPVGNRGGMCRDNARTGKRSRFPYRVLCAANAKAGSRRKPIQRPPCLVARLFDSYHVRIKLPLFVCVFSYFKLFDSHHVRIKVVFSVFESYHVRIKLPYRYIHVMRQLGSYHVRI